MWLVVEDNRVKYWTTKIMMLVNWFSFLQTGLQTERESYFLFLEHWGIRNIFVTLNTFVSNMFQLDFYSSLICSLRGPGEPSNKYPNVTLEK